MLTLACACGGIGEYVIVSLILSALAALGIIRKKTNTQHLHNEEG